MAEIIEPGHGLLGYMCPSGAFLPEPGHAAPPCSGRVRMSHFRVISHRVMERRESTRLDRYQIN
jgi:hypothetical protein